MKHRSKRFLGILLSLVLILGLMPGMSLTAYAAPTETLLTTITATGKEQANYSTANVATVSFSYTAEGYSVYNANWGWWGYGWSATVNAAEGYNITKCIFYDDANRTATDSEAPFVVETTEEDKTPQVNGTTINSSSKGIKKIEVYGYATPAHTHSFTYSASGAAITATCTAGCPDGYNTNGITLTISAPTILVCDGNPKTATISGYPSTAPAGLAAAPTSISYNTSDGSAPTQPGDYTASFTWGDKTASVSFTLTAQAPTTYKVNVNPQNCAWDITPREAWEGTGVPAGTLITVTPTPFVNYELESISWSKVGSQEKTDITNQGSFNMPASDVNVYIVCKPVGGGGGGSSSGGGDEWYGGYATQRGYRVRLAPVTNGSAVLAVEGWSTTTEMSVVPTTLVCVYPTPAPGYELASIVWGPEGGAGTDITGNQSFVMPSMDVVVSVTFRPVA